MTRVLRMSAIALPVVALLALPAAADVKTRDRSQIKFEGMLGRMVGMFGARRPRKASKARPPSKATAKRR